MGACWASLAQLLPNRRRRLPGKRSFGAIPSDQLEFQNLLLDAADDDDDFDDDHLDAPIPLSPRRAKTEEEVAATTKKRFAEMLEEQKRIDAEIDKELKRQTAESSGGKPAAPRAAPDDDDDFDAFLESVKSSLGKSAV
eukprot:m.63036 g.63036  ORF g.63036 m.63036 type:complete len:139 (+) comp7169_c0_seq1:22-438(+)